MATTEAYYSRQIKMPKSRAEGFQNFVQMIINHLETGNSREALLQAVDLLDTISGKANPYSEITDESVSFNRMIAELKEQHARQMTEAIARATKAGIEEGKRLQKLETAKKLGLL
jgi:hypothetical protein